MRDQSIKEILQHVRDETRAHHARKFARDVAHMHFASRVFIVAFCVAFPFVMT